MHRLPLNSAREGPKNSECRLEPRFTISLKRGTQNLELSTSSQADHPNLSAAVNSSFETPLK
jgi:hypothetical protein